MLNNPFSSFETFEKASGGNRQSPLNRLSYVKGDTTSPLLRKTIPQLLDETVQKNPSGSAFVLSEQGIRWSWLEFKRQVEDLAAGLLAIGLKAGDRVGIWSPNRSEWVVTQFATAQIGIVLVNINPAYRVAELEYALNKVRIKALILAEKFKTSDYVDMVRSLAPELENSEPGRLYSQRLPHLRWVIQTGKNHLPGMQNFSDLLKYGGPAQKARLGEIARSLQPDDAINVQFTSGTTGSPKGATLSHHNIINNAWCVAQAMKLTHQDRLCVPVPLYHCFGMVLSVLACVSVGASMVFPGEAFEPAATLKAVSEERCTALHGVPTMFIAELALPNFSEYDLSSLRTGIMAGAPCPIETMKRVVQDMNMHEVTIAYGMTETSPVSFQSSTDDPLEKRVSTVGRVMPHLEIKIVDDQGQVVPVGTKGELCTRGYSVMKGYWEDPDKSADAIHDGWMFTGDLATLDEDGYCNIVGRVKDMLIRGGENIYPREIEEFLFRNPKVSEVQIFGVPDPKYGEEICAWIVLKSGQSMTEDEVKNFCRGQIAHYKVPRYVKFVQALPMTVTGKPQKFVMSEMMAKELGLTKSVTA
ncbi:AMP-binding protein [Limnohabitans sp. T6-20]|uniref:AMP-binding protein n=1 Tax=Limnohabitans sp. T6-20 TaxID=1100725 RepID=UPI000D38F772|nr:AMP-binding protein [Limnohabitans sp. T6-20]PUE12215.1 AMP-binding protein [Limnohabitans sp. T6-20]